MSCPRCGLPDPYCGQGDAIGSCDCPRCDCCAAGPDDCDCRRDWEPCDDEDDNGPFDHLCNDPACDYRRGRATATAGAA
jgi:hypothetical protein